MPVTGEAICSTAGVIAPAVNMLDKTLHRSRETIHSFIAALQNTSRIFSLESSLIDRR